MLQAKRLTRKQKEILKSKKLNPENWLLIKNLKHQGELHIQHRDSEKVRVLNV